MQAKELSDISLFCVCVCVHVFVHAHVHAYVLTRLLCIWWYKLQIQYFSIVSHKQHDVKKKVIEHEMCVLISSTTLSATFLILEFRDIWSEIYTGLHVMFLLFLSDFNQTWIFLTLHSRSTKILNSMKICLVGEELLHVNKYRTTDMTKLRVTFCNFVTKPKNYQ
jgi:hypothetical protein